MASDATLGFGVIGLGSIAGHHLEAIRASEGCRLVAVSSRSEERREQAQLGSDVARFSDYQQLVADPQVDVVSICTPSGRHLEPALAAAAAGKHVVVEKPLEINTERGLQMVRACRQAGVQLSCIFQNRYADGYGRVRELVADGTLGRLVLGNAYIKWHRDQAYYDANDWRGTLEGDGGAVLINQSIHTIDLLLTAMGPVSSVRGKVATLTHDIEGEDVGAAVLQFESGALATIEGSTSLFEGFPERLEVHGDAGSVVLEAGEVVELRTRTGESAPQPKALSASGSSDPMAIDTELHCRQFAEIATALRRGVAPQVDGLSALRSVQVIEAIYESSRSGREVALKPLE